MNPELAGIELSPELEKYINEMQMRDTVRSFNGLVERCFHNCIKDFGTRSITDKEELCLVRCTDKFMKHSMRVARVFSEQGILQHQAQNSSTD